jgi:putative nucleotidyltransferase with HDIG domain
MAETIVSPEEILKSVKRVPALSPGASRLLDVLGTGCYEVADIVQVIETDSGLTANVLKVVNSAAMGLRRDITTVHQAVAFLGDTKIIGIALTNSGGEIFNQALAGYAGDRGDLGRHCLWVAIAARELARHTGGRVDKGVAFTAGLLHDIGKVVISDFMVEVMPRIVAGASDETFGDHLEAERQVMGTDHCEVGRELGRHWRMPESLVAGIQHHHRPALAPEDFRPMAYVIHLADTLAMMQGIGTGVDDMQYELAPDYADHVQIEASGLEGLTLDTQIDFKATAEALFGEDQEKEE